MILRIFLIVLCISIILGEMARRFLIKRDKKYRAEPFSLDLTGAEFARRILEAKEIEDVEIVESRAIINDHYLLRTKTIRLSPQNFHGKNLAAAGIAAHTAGHAIQHARGHGPLYWRRSAILYTYYASVGVFLIAIPLIFISRTATIAILGGGWGLIRLYNILTLPTEIDASGRVKDLIYNTRLLRLGKEFDKLQEMLQAAALDKFSGFLKFWNWVFSWIFFWKKTPGSPR